MKPSKFRGAYLIVKTVYAEENLRAVPPLGKEKGRRGG